MKFKIINKIIFININVFLMKILIIVKKENVFFYINNFNLGQSLLNKCKIKYCKYCINNSYNGQWS